MCTIAVKHDFTRQAFNLAQRNVRSADTKDSSSFSLYDLHKALGTQGDETFKHLCTTLKCIQWFWLGQSEKHYQMKIIKTRFGVYGCFCLTVIINRVSCVCQWIKNTGPLLLCRPWFTDPARLASGSLSFSTSRRCQWQTGTLMSKHCLRLPAYSQPGRECRKGAVTLSHSTLLTYLSIQYIFVYGDMCNILKQKYVWSVWANEAAKHSQQFYIFAAKCFWSSSMRCPLSDLQPSYCSFSLRNDFHLKVPVVHFKLWAMLSTCAALSRFTFAGYYVGLSMAHCDIFLFLVAANGNT